MVAMERPVTGADHMAKEIVIHAGLVFSGHMDVLQLQKAASQIVDIYPELNVVPKRKLLSPGRWYTPPSDRPSWDFKHRSLPEKSLADVFAPAATFSSLDLDSSTVTPLGASDVEEMNGYFSFEGYPISSLGWSPFPTLSFRVTLLGDQDNGHTLLGLIVPHLITDATGVADIIKTWGRLYLGETVPTRTGAAHPDLIELLDSNPIENGKDDQAPGDGFSYGIFDCFSFIRKCLRYSKDGVEERYIHFPRKVLERYRDEARSQLSADEKGLHVSRLDVFCAMMIKLYAHSSLVADPSQPFDLYHVFYMSPGFPRDSLPSPYLHNLNSPGWFPFPSSSSISSTPLSDLATTVRRRLNTLRTPNNVRERIIHFDKQAAAFFQVPSVNPKHGWGLISSWKEVDEMARAGFEGENLLFVRPVTQNPMDMLGPNMAYPVGDGNGGLIARVTVLREDWDKMWLGAGLGSLN